jgi:oligopeptide/dipeptide ABC transporter ATP-binding protein
MSGNADQTAPLLSVRGLKTHFHTPRGTVKAVDEVDMEAEAGQRVALVGESGSGKSVTAKSIMGIVEEPGEIVGGEVQFTGTDLTTLSESELTDIRGNEISMIFQSPMTALNPTLTVGRQVARVLQLHREEFEPKENSLFGPTISEQSREKVISLFENVELPDAAQRFSQYPHQLSGGMKQRVLIAMALACDPDLLIADEPTTALDVTVESKIFDLIDDLVDEMGVSLLLITHDLGVVAHSCEVVNIMYAGEIVEKGTVDEVFHDPKHPYTRELLRSLPSATPTGDRLHTIEGTVPDATALPRGCRFAPRCPEAFEDCSEKHPDQREFDDRKTRCLLYDQAGDRVVGTDSSQKSIGVHSTEASHED